MYLAMVEIVVAMMVVVVMGVMHTTIPDNIDNGDRNGIVNELTGGERWRAMTRL